jgi:hypothetical protein
MPDSEINMSIAGQKGERDGWAERKRKEEKESEGGGSTR